MIVFCVLAYAHPFANWLNCESFRPASGLGCCGLLRLDGGFLRSLLWSLLRSLLRRGLLLRTGLARASGLRPGFRLPFRFGNPPIAFGSLSRFARVPVPRRAVVRPAAERHGFG